MGNPDQGSAHSMGWAMLATALLSLVSASTKADSPPKPIDSITVEAKRSREAIKLKVDNFIGSIVVHSIDESVARWGRPVCPLVAGLSRDMGELILQRVSLAVKNANAPLAAEKCEANFFMIVIAQPDLFLKKWYARSPRMLNDARGVAGIKRFLNSTRPIRVWYNAGAGCGSAMVNDGGLATGLSSNISIPTCLNSSGVGSPRLHWQTVRTITSVILVIDAERVRGLNVGQLADYLAMLGLAEIRLDKDPGPEPTILRLFSETEKEKPQTLSKWDEAFLKALYTTTPSSSMQISMMKTKMLGYVAP
jgi:hypothetical protein